MPHPVVDERPSRGHKKRERTRAQLIAAGAAVLADKGDGLTVSDVVARAEVSNGTFYNYFDDRDDLIDALAAHSLVSIAKRAAVEMAEADPAARFATATARVLHQAMDDPTWGRALLRLVDQRRSSQGQIQRHLREDLETGLAGARFAYGADEVTLDLVTGLILMTIRRIVHGEAGAEHVRRVIERMLLVLDVEPAEASELAVRAMANPPDRSIPA